MKFQILIRELQEDKRKITGHTHEAVCWNLSVNLLGDSREEVLTRATSACQRWLDSWGGGWVVADLQPSPKRAIRKPIESCLR
jgi:hypothetical protein